MSTTSTSTADVVVAGAGPAGWSLAAACADRGLDVVLVDPRPERAWRHTYGLWDHELPADLPARVVATCAHGVAIAAATHDLAAAYAVLDTAALQRHLHRDAVRVRSARAVATAAGPPGVVLDDGTEVHAPLVADASGAAQSLSRSRSPSPSPSRSARSRPGRPSAGAAEQTAYGVVVDRDVADRVTGGRLVFMDWRPVHGRPGWPTFLYAIPLDARRVLLEETSLARRPGLGLPELRARLDARLRAHGLRDADLPDDGTAATERVRFPVDSPRHDPPPGVVALGAAAPLVHPASGYSLATSLALAPRVAEAVARALDGRDPATTAVAAARGVVDPPTARVVHALRRRGLDVLLRMPPGEVPGFFDAFFAMPAHHQRAYLSTHDDVGASVAAMTALFGRLPRRARAHLVAGTLLGPGPAATDE